MKKYIKMNYVGFVTVHIYAIIFYGLVEKYGSVSTSKSYTYGFWEVLEIALFIGIIFCLGKYSKFSFED